MIRTLRCRSGGEHSDPEHRCGAGHSGPEPAVEVRVLFRSSGEHGDLELAVEVRWRKEEEEEEGGGQAVIISNNLPLTGGKIINFYRFILQMLGVW